MNRLNNILFIIIFLFSFTAKAQKNFSQNPFLKEKSFFVSAYEKEVFEEYNKKCLHTPFKVFFALEPNNGASEVVAMEKEINNFCNELKQKKYKFTTDLSYLYKVFYTVQKRYLKKYEAYTNLSKLLKEGSFDCLTATAFYSIILDRLGYKYSIKETSIHSYLVVHLKDRDILFESTDPEEGFVSNNRDIKTKELVYGRQIPINYNNLTGLTGETVTHHSSRFYLETIDFLKLGGLHYYNQAVVKYNSKNYKAAVNFLEKAFMVYPSQRTFNLLIKANYSVLSDPSISKEESRIYLAKIKYYSMNGEEFLD